MTETSTTRILVVDDEAQVRTLLRNVFQREGFSVCEAGNGTELFEGLKAAPVSLITLDLTLGGEDGLALAREVRAKHDVPIIMISAKADEVDRIVGLELGADDYICKPFNVREALARVRAVLRRYEPRNGGPVTTEAAARERYAFAGMTVDLTSRDLTTADGEKIGLTTAEFDLLCLLVKRPLRVMSRDTIMDLLKGHEWSPLDRTIDTLVARLRKKIEHDPDAPSLIKSVRGVGYIFSVEVASR